MYCFTVKKKRPEQIAPARFNTMKVSSHALTFFCTGMAFFAMSIHMRAVFALVRTGVFFFTGHFSRFGISRFVGLGRFSIVGLLFIFAGNKTDCTNQQQGE